MLLVCLYTSYKCLCFFWCPPRLILHHRLLQGQKAVTQVFYKRAAKEEISGLKARLATMEVALQV